MIIDLFPTLSHRQNLETCIEPCEISSDFQCCQMQEVREGEETESKMLMVIMTSSVVKS